MWMDEGYLFNFTYLYHCVKKALNSVIWKLLQARNSPWNTPHHPHVWMGLPESEIAYCVISSAPCVSASNMRVVRSPQGEKIDR